MLIFKPITVSDPANDTRFFPGTMALDEYGNLFFKRSDGSVVNKTAEASDFNKGVELGMRGDDLSQAVTDEYMEGFSLGLNLRQRAQEDTEGTTVSLLSNTGENLIDSVITDPNTPSSITWKVVVFGDRGAYTSTVTYVGSYYGASRFVESSVVDLSLGNYSLNVGETANAVDLVANVPSTGAHYARFAKTALTI